MPENYLFRSFSSKCLSECSRAGWGRWELDSLSPQFITACLIGKKDMMCCTTTILQGDRGISQGIQSLHKVTRSESSSLYNLTTSPITIIAGGFTFRVFARSAMVWSVPVVTR